MSDGLRMRYDADVDALYLRLREGEVAATIEVEEMVYLDVDNEGRAVGIEFVSGADFLPFLQRQGGAFTVSDQVEVTIESVTT